MLINYSMSILKSYCVEKNINFDGINLIDDLNGLILQTITILYYNSEYISLS